MGFAAAIETIQREPRLRLNWEGQYCAIIACGPSAKSANIEQLRGRLKVIAIKEAFEIAPFADVVYGCDFPWWKHRHGLKEFKGVKIGWDTKIRDLYPDVRLVEIKRKLCDELLFDEPMSIGAGGNSGFQAINLAVQWGVRGILLIGIDCTGSHFYGRNFWNRANNPTLDNFNRWTAAFKKAEQQLKDRVDVVSSGALQCFRRQSIEATLAEWDV